MTELGLKFRSLDSQGQQDSSHYTGKLWQKREKPSFHLGLWETIIQVLKMKCHFQKKKQTLLICSIFSCPWIISINKNLMISGGLLSSLKKKKKSNFEKPYYRSLAKAWFRCQVGKTHTQSAEPQDGTAASFISTHTLWRKTPRSISKSGLEVYVTICGLIWQPLFKPHTLPNYFSLVNRENRNQHFLRINRFYWIL